MPEPYFKTDGAPVAGVAANSFELVEDALRPGELVAVSTTGGLTVRVRLDEARAVRTATALIAWYHARSIVEEDVVPADADIVTQYRDGLVYSFASDPEV